MSNKDMGQRIVITCHLDKFKTFNRKNGKNGIKKDSKRKYSSNYRKKSSR